MTPTELAREKLSSSVLTLDDAKKLGIKILDAKQTAAKVPGSSSPSLELNYYTADGKLRTDIVRYRLLGAGPFGAAPSRRYHQPHGTTVGAYLPRTQNWKAIFADPSTSIIITEGELKAACACLQGFPTIGLGGVSSWRSARKGWSFLPELSAAEWKERTVYICFDSDAMIKSQVAAATMSLANALIERGAVPKIATLPVVDGYEKTGLDDFLFARGKKAFEAELAKAQDDALSRSLWEFNARFAYIHSSQFIWDSEHRVELSSATFTGLAMSNVHATQRVGEKQKSVCVAEAWMKWPQRREFSAMTFAPGRGEVVDNKLNSWLGWGCDAREGSIKPWTALLDLLFKGADPASRLWFERWCGYPIKVPGTKNLAACGLWSLLQGQGKSLVGVTLSRIYGDGYATISQRELESTFNGWAANRQFVMVDDVSAHDSRAKADILKKTITQEQVLVNRKFVGEYYLPDVANYYLTSNRADAFFLEDNDRRFFIHEVTAEKLPAKFYLDYHKWLGSGGAAALRYYFEHELDYADYSPYTEPPKTAAKDEMIELGRTEMDTWMADLRAEPAEKLRIGKVKYSRDVYTSAEILALFDAQRTNKRDPLTAIGIGKALRRAGFSQPAHRSKVRVGEETCRLYVVRNDARWLCAPTEAIVAHIIAGRKKDGVEG